LTDNTIAYRLARGFELRQRGDLAAAENVFRKILREEPNNFEAQRLLGEVLIDRGQIDKAILLLSRLVSQHQNQASAHYALGNGYRLSGQHKPAIAAYRNAIALSPDFAGSYHGLGLALRNDRCEREALDAFRTALRLQPNWAIAWKDLGLTFAMLGELGLAEAALRRAINIQPGLGDAHRHLAVLRNDLAEAQEIARLTAAAADPRTPPGEQIELLFTLGRLLDKAGSFTEAFQYFSAANAKLRTAQARANIVFDRAQLSRDVDALTHVFSETAFATHPRSDEGSEIPVFIVGNPRTGSTLVEQIAACHSEVCGAGEMHGIGEIAGKIGWSPGPAWSTDNIGAAATSYLAAIRQIGGKKLRVIDKMPDNVFQLGLISALFPKARIIFCTRDARDVALSCFFQYFANPYSFDTDLDDCMFRIREVDRLIAHWRNVLPLAHMTISYEALLAEPEKESRRLIAFLGLEWEENCLHSHRLQRAVHTASWAQVRQPLYHSAIGRWQNYKEHFIGGTDAAGESAPGTWQAG
jgi:tetratricopeptide (TPR) repeat protein